MHQSTPADPSPPPPSLPGYCGAFARLVSPGGGAFANFALPRGPGICQPQGQPRTFDTHAVSYQNMTTGGFYWKYHQIGSSAKDRKKLKRFVKACPRFYVCISSLLINPELHSEIGSYRRESMLFWLLNQISVDII